MKNKMLSFFKITFVLSTILLISSSCTKDKWYSDTDIFTRDFTVLTGDWSWDSGRSSYYYRFDDNIIIPNVVENGSVNVTVFIDGSYRLMPYTFYFEENGVRYAETINCEYNNGYIRFDVTALDQFNDTPPNYQPDTYRFRVAAISYL